VTGRERVRAALELREPDRVPIDIAATASSELEPGARVRLAEHLGLPSPDLEALLDALEPDAARVRLGRGGGVNLWKGISVTETALDEAAWPDTGDPALFEGLRRQARSHRERGRAVVLDTEFGLVDGLQKLRGSMGWLADLAASPAFAEALMERVASVCADIVRRALQALGDDVDAVVLYEDLAGQTRTMMSPEVYRLSIKPFHAALVEAIHTQPAVKAVLHCDGAVSDLLGDFVEIGVDAVNPVQTSAEGMEPDRLKREFGDRLCFWGGCDAPWALAFGTPYEVEAKAKRALEALAPGGGYVFGPVHPIDDSIPPANVLALLHAARASPPSA
jgi:uroporphyrinogen decarboxylase